MSVSGPIRIFVGCAANNEDLESQAVLDYTLHKYASMDLEIEWMMQSLDPKSFWYGWNTVGWATPFSGFRWGVPARCNFEGRAIYMDSDFIVRADIAEIWKRDFFDKQAMISKGNERFCLTVFNNEKMKPYLLDIDVLKKTSGAHRRQRQALAGLPDILQHFGGHHNWNCVDGEDFKSLSDRNIKALHYSAIECQPQLRFARLRLEAEGKRHWFKGEIKPHWRLDMEALFDKLFEEAAEAGYVPENYRVEPFGDYEAGGSEGGAWVNPGNKKLPRGR